jgi:hypothetical protein
MGQQNHVQVPGNLTMPQQSQGLGELFRLFMHAFPHS